MLLGFIDDTIRPSPGAETAVSEHSVTNRANDPSHHTIV